MGWHKILLTRSIPHDPSRAADAHFRHYFALSLGIYAALGVISLLLFALLWTPLAPALSLPRPKP